MKKIRVTRVRSSIGVSGRQKANLEALGLFKTNASREHQARPEVLGMIKKVSHLVTVEEIEEGAASSEASE